MVNIAYQMCLFDAEKMSRCWIWIRKAIFASCGGHPLAVPSKSKPCYFISKLCLPLKIACKSKLSSATYWAECLVLICYKKCPYLSRSGAMFSTGVVNEGDYSISAHSTLLLLSFTKPDVLKYGKLLNANLTTEIV